MLALDQVFDSRSYCYKFRVANEVVQWRRDGHSADYHAVMGANDRSPCFCGSGASPALTTALQSKYRNSERRPHSQSSHHAPRSWLIARNRMHIALPQRRRHELGRFGRRAP